MKPSDLVLRCYAEQDSDGTWFTMCIDVNLYARGESFEEARQKLHGFIHEYVAEALTVDSAHIGDLIPRKAPSYFIFKYHFIGLVCQCKKVINVAKEMHRCLFQEYLPLVVA